MYSTDTKSRKCYSDTVSFDRLDDNEARIEISEHVKIAELLYLKSHNFVKMSKLEQPDETRQIRVGYINTPNAFIKFCLK